MSRFIRVKQMVFRVSYYVDSCLWWNEFRIDEIECRSWNWGFVFRHFFFSILLLFVIVCLNLFRNHFDLIKW